MWKPLTVKYRYNIARARVYYRAHRINAACASLNAVLPSHYYYSTVRASSTRLPFCWYRRCCTRCFAVVLRLGDINLDRRASCIGQAVFL